MAGSKWDFETGTVATAVGAMFAEKGSERPENPYDEREKRPLTDEEKAELQAAKDRIEAIRQRVAEKQRAQSDGSGRQ